MRKITKLSLGVGGFVLLVIILLLVLPFLIPLDKFLPRIESSLENALHRKVKIEKLQLSLLPGLGLDLKGLEVSNQEGFSPKPFIQVDKVRVRLSLLALLKNQFLVPEVVLKNPRVILERNQKGEFNFQDLTKREKSPAQKPEKSEEKKELTGFELKLLGRELVVKSFQMKNGELEFNDAQVSFPTPHQLKLYRINLELEDISSHQPIPFKLNFCEKEKCSEEQFFLKGKIGPVSGELDVYSLPLELKIQLDNFELSPFLPYFEKSLPLKVKSGKINGRMELSGQGSELKAEAELGLKNLNLGEPRAGWQTIIPLISLKIPFQGSIKPLKIQAKNSQLQLSSSQLNFDLKLEKTSGFAYLLVIKDSTLAWKEVLELYPPIKTTLLEKNISLDGAFKLVGKIHSASPLNFQMDLNLAESGLIYPGVMEKKPGEKMSLNLSGVKQGSRLSLDKFRLDFAPGQIQGGLNLKSTSPLKGDFSLSSSGLDLDKILPKEKPAGKKPEQKKEKKPAPSKPSKQPSSLEQAELKGKIKVSHLKARGYELNDLSTQVNLRRAKLVLSNLRAKGFGGGINGKINLVLSPKAILSGKVNLEQIELKQALAQIRTLKDNFQGRATSQIKFNTPLESWEKIKPKLRAEGNLKIDDGVLLTLDLLGSLLGDWASSDAFRSFLQEQMGKKEWEVVNQTRFKELEGKFRVSGGKVKISPLVMAVEEGKMTLEGKFGFDYQVDFKGKMNFTKEASGEIARKIGLSEDARNILFYQGRRLILPLKIKGKYPKLQVQLDQKEYGEIIQENLKSQAQEKIRKEGEKLIKDLLKQIIPE